MILLSTDIPADEELFEVHFAMRHGEALVDCAVEEEAIDDVDGRKDDRPLVERFARNRQLFEQIANSLYAEGRTEPRIGVRHVEFFQAHRPLMSPEHVSSYSFKNVHGHRKSTTE